MSKIVLFFILIIALCSPCFAQTNQTESLTITTYYPAPYGVYRNLRLHPSNVPTVGVDRGVIYYDNATNEIKYYAGPKGWVNLTGGGNGTGYWAEDADQYIHNTNSKARVIVGGAGAGNEEVLWVEGDMRVFHKPPLGDGNSLIYLTRNNTTNTATYGFTTYTGGDPGYGIRYFGNPGKLTIETGPPGWYRSITISNSSVGIGNTNPVALLHVGGTALIGSPDPSTAPGETGRIRWVRDYFVAGGVNDALIIEKTEDDLSVGGGIVLGFSTSANTDTHFDQPGWAVNHYPVLVIRGNRRVGVGTTAPVEKLEVYDGAIYINQTPSRLIMKSPNGACNRCQVPDGGGNLNCIGIACP